MIVALFTAHVCRPPLDKEYDACKASAAGMLAFRPHTRSELSTKLTDKGYDKACIERSISRLQELASQRSCPLHSVSRLSDAPCVPRSSAACCALPSCAHAGGLPPCYRVCHLHSCRSVRAGTRGPDVRSAVLQGLQSDAEFATVFARSKWRQSRWAPSRIRIVSTPLLSSQMLPRCCLDPQLPADLASFAQHCPRHDNTEQQMSGFRKSPT